jgi:hypothetical protein
VKKQTQKSPAPPAPQPAEKAPQIEEQLTDITTGATAGLKRNWKPIAGIVTVIVAVVLAYQGTRSLEEGRRDKLHSRFYEMFDLKVARDETPDEDGLRALLTEVRDTPTEVFMVKRLVNYKLTQADDIEKAQTDDPPASGDADTAPATQDPMPMRQSAAALAQDLADRHPASEDVQLWKTAVTKRVEAAKNEEWLPPPRRYQLPVVPPQ